MNFFEWLFSKRRSLAAMDAAELRAQEMLLQSDRDRMAARMSKLARDKQELIERGAKEKTPEMRRTFAQQYDLLHTEQSLVARQLNIRGKELITVARLRMLRENAQRSGLRGGVTGMIRETDLGLLERLIENDRISTEMYQERLDQLLEIGSAADEATTGMSPAAAELLKVWNDMDAGLIKDSAAAFDEAEKRVRERQRADG